MTKKKQTKDAEEVKQRKVKEDHKLGKCLTPDGLTLLRAWARDGITYKMMAERLGVSEYGFTKFRKKHPEVAEALAQDREFVDYLVENALLKSALGYTQKETKVVIGKPNALGEREIRREEITKEVPPNPTSIAIWLNNRQPDKWKRNRDNFNTNTGDIGKGITVNIIRHGEEADVKDEKWSASAKINEEDDDDEWED